MDSASLLLIGIALFFICVFILLVYSGLLESINFKIEKPPHISSKIFMYKFYQGRYRDSGAGFQAAFEFVKDIKGNIVAGIYYDDPSQVPEDKTKYACGVLLSPDSDDHQKVVDTMRHAGYSIFRLPVVERAIVTVFPYRNLLSIFIAVWRVYPAMRNFIKETRLKPAACMEVYVGSRIYFINALEKGPEFLVPEAR